MAIYGSGQKDGFGMEGYAGEISSSASTPWGTRRSWLWARVDWAPDGIAESDSTVTDSGRFSAVSLMLSWRYWIGLCTLYYGDGWVNTLLVVVRSGLVVPEDTCNLRVACEHPTLALQVREVRTVSWDVPFYITSENSTYIRCSHGLAGKARD
jgi:hypothetical protein